MIEHRIEYRTTFQGNQHCNLTCRKNSDIFLRAFSYLCMLVIYYKLSSYNITQLADSPMSLKIEIDCMKGGTYKDVPARLTR